MENGLKLDKFKTGRRVALFFVVEYMKTYGFGGRKIGDFQKPQL